MERLTDEQRDVVDIANKAIRSGYTCVQQRIFYEDLVYRKMNDRQFTKYLRFRIHSKNNMRWTSLFTNENLKDFQNTWELWKD